MPQRILADQDNHVFAFKRSWNNRRKFGSIDRNPLDTELVHCVDNLIAIANHPDLRLIGSRNWQQFVELYAHKLIAPHWWGLERKAQGVAIAQTLIHQGQLDVLMLRYNMAHRKIEQDVLPLAQLVGLPIVAFTCTQWSTLFQGHPQWQSAPPTASDYYRYALHHPAVQVALTAPTMNDQLQQNSSVLQRLDLSEADRQHWQTYDDLVYGNGEDAFETQ